MEKPSKDKIETIKHGAISSLLAQFLWTGGAVLMAWLASFAAYVTGFGPLWVIVLGGLVLLIYLLVAFLVRVQIEKRRASKIEQQPEPVKELAQLQTLESTVEKLNDHIKELERELKNETKKYNFELNQKETIRNQRDSIESELGTLKTQYNWLHEKAEKHAEAIGDYVVIEKVYFCYDRLTDIVPLIVFGVDIRNKSVFDIVIEDTLKGQIETYERPLLENKRIISKSDKIGPSDKGHVTIEQCLSEPEAKLIAKYKEEYTGAVFYFDKLKIVIKERTEHPTFQRTELELPRYISHKDNRLASLVEYDKMNLNKVVQVQHMTWNPAYLSDDNPYTEFTFSVFNGSVFDLTVEEAVSGFISFARSRLSRAIHLAESSARQIRHGETARVRVHQWLDPIEVGIISKAPDVDMRFCFEFSKLTINVSSDQGLDPAPLYFPGGMYKNSTRYS